jgi:sugar phosphate isomerase/epimerase
MLPAMPPLAYSSNLHAAETVAEVASAVRGFTAEARSRLGWPSLGLDLRLGSRAIAELDDAPARDALRRELNAAGAAAFTINAFPLRPFQAPVVKRDAYLPDWTARERLDDTLRLIPIALALSDEPEVTISTVPGTYRPLAGGPAVAAAVAAAFGEWAAAAARSRRDTGRSVVLCVEPEPWCLLETSWEIAWFWRGPLASSGLEACARALDGDRDAAREALARHLGVCVDTCHLSLAFEDQRAAVERMAGAGARIAKCQFSAAPEVRDPARDPEGVAALRALVEPRFCHQTAAGSAGGSLAKVEDLDQLDRCLAMLPGAAAVRSHFHIPVFREPSERGLSTTVRDSLAGLAACRAAGCTHLSVETYTWSILAPTERDALAGTVRELAWLRERL